MSLLLPFYQQLLQWHRSHSLQVQRSHPPASHCKSHLRLKSTAVQWLHCSHFWTFCNFQPSWLICQLNWLSTIKKRNDKSGQSEVHWSHLLTSHFKSHFAACALFLTNIAHQLTLKLCDYKLNFPNIFYTAVNYSSVHTLLNPLTLSTLSPPLPCSQTSHFFYRQEATKSLDTVNSHQRLSTFGVRPWLEIFAFSLLVWVKIPK